jgi:hypothetical protein
MMLDRPAKGPKRPQRWFPRCPPGRSARRNSPVCRRFVSGANGIRTRDLLLAKQALSQLSYGPASNRV